MPIDPTAPTLVFIPGLLSDSVVWQAIGDQLQDQYAIHYADISALESITGAAGQILLETRGPLIVAGHSLGARIALEMYAQAAERFRGLLLADTGTHPKKEGENESRHVMIDLANQEGLNALAERWLPPMVHTSRHTNDPVMQSLHDMVLRASTQQHERQMIALLNRPPAEAILKEITCPVLVLVGRQDQWSPVEQHEAMRDAIYNAELAIIEDAGHFAPIERIDETAAALNQWLNKHFSVRNKG